MQEEMAIFPQPTKMEVKPVIPPLSSMELEWQCWWFRDLEAWLRTKPQEVELASLLSGLLLTSKAQDCGVKDQAWPNT
jgi:hypothetical protein